MPENQAKLVGECNNNHIENSYETFIKGMGGWNKLQTFWHGCIVGIELCEFGIKKSTSDTWHMQIGICTSPEGVKRVTMAWV